MTQNSGERGLLRNSRVVIVGAGPVGLAMGHALARRGLLPQRDFYVIDEGRKRVAEELQGLHLTARLAVLPGALPPQIAGPLTVEEHQRYLDDYATRFGIFPLWGCQFESIRPDPHGHGLRCAMEGEEIGVRNVVVTVGSPLQLPSRPTPGMFVVRPDYRSWRLRLKSMRVAHLIANRP